MANQWFRMYAEFATDPKVQMLTEAMQRRYIMLLCFRCSNGDVTLHDEEVTFLLRISNEEWADTKAVFLAKDLIDKDNKPTAWDKRQYVSDSSAARVSAHRAKKKQACNVTVTPPDTDTDTDTEEKKSAKAPASLRAADLVKLGIDEQVANDFLAIRKAKRAPLTTTALDGIKREADKAGVTLSQALATCAVRGWQSFKAEWDGVAAAPAAPEPASPYRYATRAPQ